MMQMTSPFFFKGRIPSLLSLPLDDSNPNPGAPEKTLLMILHFRTYCGPVKTKHLPFIKTDKM